MVESLDLVVLARVVVPARADRDVGLARDPGVAVLVPDVELGRPLGGPHEVLGAPVGVPVGLPGDAALVADPAQVRTAPVEDDRVRLVLVDGALEEVPVVLLALPVRALATRAVEPDLEDGPVAREDLGELHGEVLVVGIAVAIARLGPIPRRQVQPELEPLGPARLREFGEHVPLAVSPGAAGHVVLGDVARPQTEPVVVLGGQDHGLHASLLGHAHPLVTVELRWREGVRRLGAVPPLLVRERVHVEVHERVVLQLVPGELRARGQRQDRRRSRHLRLDGRAALEGGGDRLLDAREERSQGQRQQRSECHGSRVPRPRAPQSSGDAEGRAPGVEAARASRSRRPRAAQRNITRMPLLVLEVMPPWPSGSRCQNWKWRLSPGASCTCG